MAVAAAGAAGWLATSDSGARTRARLAPGTVPRVDSALAIASIDTAPALGADSTFPVSVPSRLTVVAPSGATIALDGGLPVAAPWHVDSLPAGRHQLRGALPSLPGCPTASDNRTIELAPGEQRSVRLRLLPCGELSLDVSPTPASFTLTPPRGSARRYQLPLDAPLVLPEGVYRVRVEARTCAPFENDSVRVTSAPTTTRLRVPLICG